MPLLRNAVTLSFCHAARSSRTTKAILVSNTAVECKLVVADKPLLNVEERPGMRLRYAPEEQNVRENLLPVCRI